MEGVMRNLIKVVVSATCAIAAMPIAAKPTPVRSAEVWEDIAELDRDVDRADARDTISEREAAGIRAQIADLKRQYHRQNANGLTPGEASALETRIGNLRARLGNEHHDRDHHRG
jgi:hypothetical protein